MLAARRGDREAATKLLADAVAQPGDGFHQPFLYTAIADVHLALGNWAGAAEAAEHGWETRPRAATLWSARYVMLGVAATVEADPRRPRERRRRRRRRNRQPAAATHRRDPRRKPQTTRVRRQTRPPTSPTPPPASPA